MHKRIVVVGSVNMDLVCSAPRIPRPGETMLGSTFDMFPGGKGANQAVAVARLGHPVAFVGKVGDDAFGPRLVGALRAAGVSTREIVAARRSPSGVAAISTDRRGQNSIVVVPGANARLMPRDVSRVRPLVASAGMILAQLEIPLETVEYLATLAARAGVPLMLDPAPAQALPSTLLERVALLTPNEIETEGLCGIAVSGAGLDSARRAAWSLRSRGCERVVIKMGRRGAYLHSTDEPGRLFPAFKVDAVDSTAAGDAFNGALAVALVQGLREADAVRFASAAAALSVTRRGAQPSMPRRRDVLRLLRGG